MKKPLLKMGLMVYGYMCVICNYVQSLVDQSRASCESQMFMDPDNRTTASTVIHCYSGLWGGGQSGANVRNVYYKIFIVVCSISLVFMYT